MAEGRYSDLFSLKQSRHSLASNTWSSIRRVAGTVTRKEVISNFISQLPSENTTISSPLSKIPLWFSGNGGGLRVGVIPLPFIPSRQGRGKGFSGRKLG